MQIISRAISHPTSATPDVSVNMSKQLKRSRIKGGESSRPEPHRLNDKHLDEGSALEESQGGPGIPGTPRLARRSPLTQPALPPPAALAWAAPWISLP